MPSSSSPGSARSRPSRPIPARRLRQAGHRYSYVVCEPFSASSTAASYAGRLHKLTRHAPAGLVPLGGAVYAVAAVRSLASATCIFHMHGGQRVPGC
jgi:hypothetical protein